MEAENYREREKHAVEMAELRRARLTKSKEKDKARRIRPTHTLPTPSLNTL